MKLRNKKTGKIIDVDYWEVYEEPKEYWYISELGGVEEDEWADAKIDEDYKEIGNYFATKEEAEKAVEKLKAWKRLKDKGFRFCGWEDLETLDPEDSFLINRDVVDGSSVVGFKMDNYDDCKNDLDLLFGGENDNN